MGKRLPIVALFCAALCGCNAQNKNTEAAPDEVEVVCANSNVPAGWFVTGYVDKKECEDDTPKGVRPVGSQILPDPVTLKFNAVEIRRFDKKAVGTVMDVCEWGNSVPGNWITLAEKHDPKCWPYKTMGTDRGQVRTIKRSN